MHTPNAGEVKPLRRNEQILLRLEVALCGEDRRSCSEQRHLKARQGSANTQRRRRPARHLALHKKVSSKKSRPTVRRCSGVPQEPSSRRLTPCASAARPGEAAALPKLAKRGGRAGQAS